jgi:hypothetical protein
MKFGMERSLKMKVVCTWGFDLKVDFDEVMEVTSYVGGSVGVTHKLLVILYSKISLNLACKNWAVLILSNHWCNFHSETWVERCG